MFRIWPKSLWYQRKWARLNVDMGILPCSDQWSVQRVSKGLQGKIRASLIRSGQATWICGCHVNMKGKSTESWKERQNPNHVQLLNHPATTYFQTPCYERKTVDHWLKLLLIVFCHLQPKAFLVDPGGGGVPALCSKLRSAWFSPFALILTCSPGGQSLGIVPGSSLPWGFLPL